MHRFEMIFIWFFAGALLLCYGIPILGAGLHGLAHPPAVVLAELRAGIWRGLLLILLGTIYSVRFSPWRGR